MTGHPSCERSPELIDHFIIYASACIHKREISTAGIGQADTAAHATNAALLTANAKRPTKKPIRQSGLASLWGY
jgi:hypothetical protein